MSPPSTSITTRLPGPPALRELWWFGLIYSGHPCIPYIHPILLSQSNCGALRVLHGTCVPAIQKNIEHIYERGDGDGLTRCPRSCPPPAYRATSIPFPSSLAISRLEKPSHSLLSFLSGIICGFLNTATRSANPASPEPTQNAMRKPRC